MKVISKTISYDDLVSRFPGVVPSIMDYWEIPSIYYCGSSTEREKYYSYQVAVKRASEYNINAAQLEKGSEFAEFNMDNILEFTKGNYGLIPSDVIIPEDIASKVTDYTDFYVNIPNGEGGFYDLSWPANETDPHYEGRKIISSTTIINGDEEEIMFFEVKILTYRTLNKWYTFFNDYYKLINDPEHNRTYESAIDYFNKEVENKTEGEKEYYLALDALFEARGGEKRYKWITNNCFIQYKVPAKFTDAWKTTYINFTDAVKWYYWFKERVEKYKYAASIEECKTTDDCCDCTEYIELGGYEFFAYLEEWINSLKDENGNFKPFMTNATNSASITIPVSFTNSIDDLGEMAIFSNKWEEEVDYHNTLSSGKGTVVHQPYKTDELTGEKTALDDTYIINNSTSKGYEYNEFYETVFNENDWSNYTDYYINNNPGKFATDGITAYTFSPLNGKIIYNPTEIISKIPVTAIENVCINGISYDVIDGKYVEMCYSDNSIADLKYKKKTKLRIYKEGDLEYAVFNGKRKYVKYLPEEEEERVYFLDDYSCVDEGCKVYSGKYVIFDNALYLLDEINSPNNVYDVLVLDDYEYKRRYPALDGYFTINNVKLYVLNGEVVIQNEVVYDEDTETYIYSFRELNDEELHMLKVTKFEVINNAKTGKPKEIKVWHMFENIVCNIVSGHTDSKLELLRRKKITVDNYPNPLPGHFNDVVDYKIANRIKPVKNSTGKVVPGRVLLDELEIPIEELKISRYNIPYDECTLDILYKKGEVSDLTPITDDSMLYNGNIIESIEFYYRNKLGDKVISFFTNDDDALEQIKNCNDLYEELNDDSIVNILMCDITYYIGAVIRKVQRQGKWQYELEQKYHKGVKYIDTLYVTKEVGTYYVSKGRTFTYNYYKLTQDVDTIYVSDLRADVKWDASTYFEIEPLLYLYSENGVKLADTDSFGEGKWSHNNNAIIAPVFRNEFNFASSLPQNVDANIYIDRGINAAYEKLLKLQEVRTMEALENLANSSGVSGFKIN